MLWSNFRRTECNTKQMQLGHTVMDNSQDVAHLLGAISPSTQHEDDENEASRDQDASEPVHSFVCFC